MKISNLDIHNYKQFQKLELDLTYPKGHPKEGQPLDKICIIGQSGTGKTNLLKIIRDRLNNDFVKTIYTDITQNIYYKSAEPKQCTKLDNIDKKTNEQIKNLKLKKAKIIENSNYILEDIYAHDEINLIDITIKELENNFTTKKNFINLNNANSWKLLKNKIDNYEKRKAKYSKELTDKLIYNESYTKDDLIKDMKKWESENENILEKISNSINLIINKFNLKLVINETTKSYEELIIKDLATNKIIRYNDISTGTKSLLSTIIPLKSYNPQDSIILIDEPENSFYPDIQKELVDLYMQVGNNNQLIVATHSPIIASCFEPWEVVELKFDDNNQIYREKYYEGENHIDNYTIDPRVLTWTGILTDVFDLKEDSNFTFREKMLMEYATLKATIKALNNKDEKEQMFIKLQKLSKKLGLNN